MSFWARVRIRIRVIWGRVSEEVNVCERNAIVSGSRLSRATVLLVQRKRCAFSPALHLYGLFLDSDVVAFLWRRAKLSLCERSLWRSNIELDTVIRINSVFKRNASTKSIRLLFTSLVLFFFWANCKRVDLGSEINFQESKICNNEITNDRQLFIRCLRNLKKLHKISI